MQFWTMYFIIIGIVVAGFVVSKIMAHVAPWLRKHEDSKNRIIQAIAKVYWPWHESRVWSEAYEAHRSAGHENPAYAAHQEIFIRGEYLERFRDEASDTYLKDKTSLDQVKKDFIRDHLSAKTTILDSQTTAAVRAVIRDMKADDAYHPPVYQKYLADLEGWSRGVMAEAEVEFGKGGYSPLQRRVLRG